MHWAGFLGSHRILHTESTCFLKSENAAPLVGCHLDSAVLTTKLPFIRKTLIPHRFHRGLENALAASAELALRTCVSGDMISTCPFRSLPPGYFCSENAQPSQSILYSLIFFFRSAMVQSELSLPFVYTSLRGLNAFFYCRPISFEQSGFVDFVPFVFSHDEPRSRRLANY